MQLGPQSKLLPGLADLESNVSPSNWSSVDDDDSQIEQETKSHRLRGF